jgi:AraC family transcriptional regulator, exoenzyme S synthesis regulatory protein ExsA
MQAPAVINLYEALKNFPNLSKQLYCKGMLFTNYECPQGTSKARFSIECNYIAYVISGRRIFHKNNKSWELKEGVCVFVKNGAIISEKPKDEGWCVMVFFVPDPFLKQLAIENKTALPSLSRRGMVDDMVIPLDVNELSKSFFSSMFPYFTQSPAPPENLLELKFKELVLSLLTNEKNGEFLSYLNSLNNGSTPTLEEVMFNNFSFKLSIEEYAKLTCKSVPTFKREFKRVFNDSPAKWVMKQRLNLASRLLETSRLSVSEIAFECGFENQTHFSRVFKEKKGISPLQFRTNPQTV